VLGALLLDALGVDEATILEDFALSQRGMDRLIADLRARGKITDDNPPNPALGVPVPAMQLMLDALRAKHGNAANFLGSHGVEDETLERLADLLLE
jgi:protein-tyrosine phosphatase